MSPESETGRVAVITGASSGIGACTSASTAEGRAAVRRSVRPSRPLLADLSISGIPVHLLGDNPTKEDAMRYMLLIHQGTTPTPHDQEAWAKLSEDEQHAVYAAYAAINENPKVSSGEQMQSPETATTVRVQDGRTLTTDGPFAELKEAIGGYLFFEADDLDAAIALAATIPAASMGGAIEIRPIVEW
jgi:hypothetical protein